MVQWKDTKVSLEAKIADLRHELGVASKTIVRQELAARAAEVEAKWQRHLVQNLIEISSHLARAR